MIHVFKKGWVRKRNQEVLQHIAEMEAAHTHTIHLQWSDVPSDMLAQMIVHIHTHDNPFHKHEWVFIEEL